MSTLKNLLAAVLEKSEFISAINSIKSAKGKSVLYGDSIRNLAPGEIDFLQSNGNYSTDWSLVFVGEGFDIEKVRNCTFIGEVFIGSLRGDVKEFDGFVSPTGLYNSTIVNSEIGEDTLIKNVKCLSNYIVKNDAIICNIGQLSCISPLYFGNGYDIKIAIETGGREVTSFADITIAIAEIVAKSRGDKELLKEYAHFIAEYCKRISLNRGVVENNAVLLNTANIKNTYVGPYALLNGATSVENATILSNENEVTKILNGSYVRNTIVQWGSEVDFMAIVDASVLTEYSKVERHGKVTESIIGPNTVIAEGEVTSSLVGPFVGFHHQALLIAALWPEGKGNIGYGANVGSNHTGKAPDQEILPGEGAFFGLGVNIKFPTDFTKAPYIIIATGVNTLPQRVEFPFSLINEISELYHSISPAFNEIFPGWVLSNNFYAIKRNESKYKKRDKAKRSKFIYDPLRTDTVDLMQLSRNRLTNVEEKKDIYTSNDIPGLGKNFMLEKSRIDGIKAYSFFIQYFALRGLARYVKKHIDEKSFNKGDDYLRIKTKDSLWEMERRLMLDEFPHNNIIINLTLYIEYAERLATMVLSSKKKDDVRGPKIIEDYASAHTPAEDDPFVQEICNGFLHAKAETYHLIEKFR